MRTASIALVFLLLTGCKPESAVESNNVPAVATNEASSINLDRVFQTDRLENIEIETTGGKLKLWVMNDPGKRQEGMMFLQDKNVPENQGMVFVFPEVQKDDGNRGFWMRNTPLALDIAYVGKDMKVVSVAKGMPFNETMLKPMGDYLYVIEVKQGLAQKFGIVKGASVKLSKELRTNE